MSDDETRVEYYMGHHGLTPLGQPALIDIAVKTANWGDDRANRTFLSPKLPYDEVEVRPGQRVWFTRALSALTREQVLKLYDALIASIQHDDRTGGDFTPQYVRDRLPHIYRPGAGPSQHMQNTPDRSSGGQQNPSPSPIRREET